MTIFFDMDGTIANLYGVENWLELLRSYDPTPYAEATPLLNLQSLARRLNRLTAKGYEIEIISWLSKTSTAEYNEAVTAAKLRWLKTHLASVKFSKINIVEYGTPKDIFRHSQNDILFDDELRNREDWQGFAFDETDIFKILRILDNE